MPYELEISEKINIVKQHLRTVSHNRFNIELSIDEAAAMLVPNHETIESYGRQLLDLKALEEMLSKKLTELESQIVEG